MRAANIFAGVVIALWFALALLGRDGLNGIVAQHALGYPNVGQVDLYVVIPLFVVAGLSIGGEATPQCPLSTHCGHSGTVSA